MSVYTNPSKISNWVGIRRLYKLGVRRDASIRVFDIMADDQVVDGGNDDVFIYMGGSIPQHLRETITHARVHKSVKIITARAFMNCRRLLSIEMHDGVEIIEHSAFRECCSLREIKLPGARIIEEDAFSDCTALESVEFGDKLETIEEWTFNYCTALRNIKLPKIRSIGSLLEILRFIAVRN